MNPNPTVVCPLCLFVYALFGDKTIWTLCVAAGGGVGTMVCAARRRHLMFVTCIWRAKRCTKLYASVADLVPCYRDVSGLILYSGRFFHPAQHRPNSSHTRSFVLLSSSLCL